MVTEEAVFSEMTTKEVVQLKNDLAATNNEIEDDDPGAGEK